MTEYTKGHMPVHPSTQTKTKTTATVQKQNHVIYKNKGHTFKLQYYTKNKYLFALTAKFLVVSIKGFDCVGSKVI